MEGPKTHRWKRIFRDDGKTVIFAMDHAGMFGMQEGLEKPGQVISKVRAGGADAILTTYGISTRFAEEIGDMGLVVRVDGGNSHLAKERSPMSLVYRRAVGAAHRRRRGGHHGLAGLAVRDGDAALPVRAGAARAPSGTCR